jgi:hypothetical protein
MGASLEDAMRTVRVSGAALLSLLVGVASSVGCSSGPDAAPSANAGGSRSSGTGSISLSLTLPGGEQFSSFSALILGPASYASTTTLSVGSSSAIRFSISLPTGAGYTAALSGTSTDGRVTCTGTSSSFSVGAGATTPVVIGMQCRVAGADAGQATLVGQSTNCATILSLLANPGETTVGSSVMLTATADGPDPSSLTYSWTAPSGTFSAPTAATTGFTCNVSGSVVVTLVSGDGPGPDGGPPCTNTTTTTIVCD